MIKKKSFFGELSRIFKTPASPRKTPLDLQQLEPRILFSVAPIDVGLEGVDIEAPMDAEFAPDFATDFSTDPLRNVTQEEFQRLFEQEYLNQDEPFVPRPIQANHTGLEYRLDGLLMESLDGQTANKDVELIFVDEDTPDYLNVVDELLKEGSNGRNFRLVTLDNDSDGISQISEILKEHSDVSAIHLISHGSSGQVNLGNTMLTLDSLKGYSGEIAQWNDSLQLGGDILIYGCNLASSPDGQTLVDSISVLTDCDVAASEDLTGHESLGGDWDLEYQIGEIATEIMFGASFQEGYYHLLEVNIDQAWLAANGGGDGPYYLNQANETYVLQTDVAADGTAFAVIADGITFDLNGHTVTYDSADPITVVNHSFELGSGELADGWDYSNAPTARRLEGDFLQNHHYDGDFSLQIKKGFTGTSTVTSNSFVTLEADTTYSLSAMFMHHGYESGLSSFVQLVGQDVGENHTVSWTRANDRGIQFTEKVFTTGAVGGTYQVVVGAHNPINDTGFQAIIDDIKIQRTRVHGVVIGPQDWAQQDYPDVTQFGEANGFHLTSSVQGGSLIQGSDGATWADAIFKTRTDTPEIDNIYISVNGANTSAFDLSRANIHDNYIESNVKVITTRDNFDGAVVDAYGDIYRNTIVGGPHTGILASGSASNIYENDISIRSRYTNGFGIMLWNDEGSQVYGNNVDFSEGDFGGRGIHVNRIADTSSPDTVVRDNYVAVKEIALNQEYGGAVTGGAFGIQLESAKNVKVFQNTIHAIADQADAAALRLNNYHWGSRNVEIYDNTFISTRLNTDVSASAMSFQQLTTDTGIIIRNNTIESDNHWLGDSWYVHGDGATFQENTFKVLGTGSGFVPVEGHNWGSGSSRAERAIQGLKFVDNVFDSSQAETLFETSSIGNALGGSEYSSSIFQSFTHTFVISDLSGDLIDGANVVVKDGNGNEVFSGATDSKGEAIVVLDEFKIQGSNKTSYGPYTVTTSFLGEIQESTFNADQKQEIALSFDIDFDGQSDTDPPTPVNILGMTLNEGAFSGIDNTLLLFEDSQQRADNVTYSVSSGLEYGQLELTTNPNVAITSFTQEDINTGRLLYRHDDSETTSDSFTFIVDDGQGNETASHTFSITVDPVDDTAPEVVNNEGVTLAEGDTAGIGNTLLRFDDSEQSASNVAYSISGEPNNGQLELTTNPNVKINSFTQADIDAGRLVYRHDHSDTSNDSFTFVVDDGQGNQTTTQTFNITVDPIDDTAPEVVNNKGVTLEEGESIGITRFDLRFLDSEQPASKVTFTLSAIPANGQLELTTAPNVAITSFTQQQINQGLLVYRHDGSDTSSDSFVFDVDDGQGNVAADQTFSITVDPIDDTAPELVNNTGATLDEGDAKGVTRIELQFDDSEQLDGKVTFSVTSGLANGQLELTTATGVSIDSFTQKDINQGLLVYRHDGSDTLADSFTFVVDDGQGNETTSHTFNITVDPVDDTAPEVVHNLGVTLNEGDVVGIGKSLLHYDDSEQAASNVTFTLTKSPVNGQLELTTNANVAITSFTQDDIDSGHLVYRHDGSDTTVDSFEFDVDDGVGNVTSDQTFDITVNPVDDTAPEVVNNKGLNLDGGEVAGIEQIDLRFTDSEQPAGSVTFTLTNTLSNGQLELTTAPNNSITSFTQQDINLGLLVYRHNGSDTTTDSFTFDVDDGKGNVTSDQTFDITIDSFDSDPPVLVNNKGLTLDEGAVSGIDQGQLHFDDSVQPASSVTYSVTSGPANGRLELTTDPNNSITSFTQEDIDLGRLVYRHDDSETTSDSFGFDVDDGVGNVLTGQAFSITVDPVDDTPPAMVNNKDALLENAEVATIKRFDLRYVDEERPAGRVTYTITGGPSNGQLELKNAPNESITSFTQQQINKGQVVYRHNGSETNDDSFTFDVSDDRGNVTLDQQFSLAIDENAPEVVNNKGVELSIGEVVKIERSDLRFEDSERPAGQVIYTVTDGLSNGRLELTTAPNKQITSFTQQDINQGLVVYKHNGSDTSVDSFTFDVSDDKGNVTAGQSFEISIDGAAPEVVNNKVMTLDEGEVAQVERFDLRFVDNERPAGRVTFTVTDTMAHGQLEYVSAPNEVITSFTQQDINKGLVVYRHDGSDTTSDTFTFDVSDDRGNVTSDQLFEFSINAIDDTAPEEVNNKGLTLNSGDVADIEKFDLRYADSEQPAGSVTYTVVDAAVNGQLELTTDPNESITSFTQWDINRGLLVYRHDSSDAASDSFEFIVDDGQGNSTTRHSFEFVILG